MVQLTNEDLVRKIEEAKISLLSFQASLEALEKQKNQLGAGKLERQKKLNSLQSELTDQKQHASFLKSHCYNIEREKYAIRNDVRLLEEKLTIEDARMRHWKKLRTGQEKQFETLKMEMKKKQDSILTSQSEEKSFMLKKAKQIIEARDKLQSQIQQEINDCSEMLEDEQNEPILEIIATLCRRRAIAPFQPTRATTPTQSQTQNLTQNMTLSPTPTPPPPAPIATSTATPTLSPVIEKEIDHEETLPIEVPVREMESPAREDRNENENATVNMSMDVSINEDGNAIMDVSLSESVIDIAMNACDAGNSFLNLLGSNDGTQQSGGDDNMFSFMRDDNEESGNNFFVNFNGPQESEDNSCGNGFLF